MICMSQWSGMISMSQFANMTSSSIFFGVAVFILLILVTGPSFMSMQLLLLELWQFFFIKDRPEIQKSEIPPSEFCPISGDWGKLGKPNLAKIPQMNFTECCKMPRLQLLPVSELLSENQKGGIKLPPSPPRLGLKSDLVSLAGIPLPFYPL